MLVPDGCVQFEGNYGTADMMRRLKFLGEQLRREGISHSITEVYRPLGKPGDELITDESKTSTQSSNVYYQYGRMLRGETPEAANPYRGQVSRHTLGIAADLNSSNIARRDAWAARLGMRRTIPVESWHYEIVGPIEAGLDVPYINETPTTKEGLPLEFMAEVKEHGKTYLRNVNGFLWINATQRDAYLKAGVKLVQFTGAEWQAVAESTNKLNADSELLSQSSYRDYRSGKK